MLQGRKKSVLILALALILVGCVVMPAFALLIHDTNVDFNVQFGDIPSEAMEFSAVNNQTFSFLRAGDVQNILLPTRNLSVHPIEYSYQLTAKSSNLTSAVLVYYDDVFVGTLAEAVLKPMQFSSVNNLLMPIDGEMSDTVSHRLTFELHKGAQDSAIDNMSCDITITLIAKTINYRENILVSNIDEFAKAIDDINYSEGSYKVIRLAKEITLDRNYKVNQSGAIDMFKGGINFNGNSIEFSEGVTEYAFNILSSRTPTREVDGNGGLLLNGNNATLNINREAKSLGKVVVLNNYNELRVQNLLISAVGYATKYGVVSGRQVDVLGGNAFYCTATVKGLPIVTGEYYDMLDGLIIAKVTPITVVDNIKIGEVCKSFKIIGAEEIEGQYGEIINNSLQHLDRLTIENNSVEVDYDLFLPKSIPSINANIEWWSSNPNILSNEGVCGDTVEGLAQLIATVRINNSVITKEFNFAILKQSNQMRFDYLVARIGEKELSALYDPTNPKGSSVILPLVKLGDAIDYRVMYSMSSLGLDSINYELSPVYSYLSMLGTPSTVYLTDNTFDEYAEVKIKGMFSNEKEKEYTASIGIVIKRLDSVKLHEQIIEYIQGLANDVDILENILTTRSTNGLAVEKGDFILPSVYRGFDLAYSPIDPIISAISLDQDLITEKYNYKFSVAPEFFYNKDTTISFNLTIKIKGWAEGGLTTQTPIQLKTPGAIHNDEKGIVNTSLFYSTRLQLIQQIKDADGNLMQGIPAITQDGITLEIEEILKNYILVDDAKYLKTLLIKTGGLEFNNLLGKMAYQAEDSLFYFNVNSLNESYEGLNIFSDLNNFQIVNSDNLLTDSAYETKQFKSNNLLNFVVNNYVNISRLEFVNTFITEATRLKLLDNLVYINLSGNSNYANIDWTMERVNNRLNYLNLSGTAYRHEESQGQLMSLYYRHHNATGGESEIYYGDNIRFSTSVDMLGQEINFKLNSLAFEKRIIDSASYQLVNSINAGGNSYSVVWSVINPEGKNYAYIDGNRKVINNIFSTAPPTDRPKQEEFILVARVEYSSSEGGINTAKNIERRLIMYAKYGG